MHGKSLATMFYHEINKIMQMRASILLLSLMFLLSGGFAFAEEQISVEAGYQGFFRPGEWTPVTLLVQRKAESAEDTQGTFSVYSQPLEGDSRIYSREVNLGVQQRIRTTLNVQISQDAQCRIQYKTRNSEFVQELAGNYLNPLMPYERLILMVNRGGYTMPKPSINIASTRIAHVQPEQLPEMWQALESVDLIIFAQDPSPDLAAEKRSALLDWLRLGGRILCIGGASTSSYKDSFLAPVLPVTCDGTRELTFQSSSKTAIFPASIMNLKVGAFAPWSQDGTPLIARWSVGKGEVVFSAVNLEDVATYAPNASAVWDAMMYDPGARPGRGFAERVVTQRVDFAFGDAARLPSVMLVLILLGTYTIIVGPVNFYLLKKQRRLELAWLTIPAIVAVFSILTYLIGSSTKGGKTILREMDFIAASANEPVARMEKFASLFAPRKRTYTLQPGEQGGMLTSFSTWNNDSPSSINFTPFGRRGQQQASVSAAGWPLALRQNGTSIFAPNRLFGQWTSQSFLAKTAVDLGGPIEGEATLQGSNLTIRLANKSQSEIQEPFIVFDRDYYPLDSLKPNQTVEISYPGGSPWKPLANHDLQVGSQQGTVSPNLQNDTSSVARFLPTRLWISAIEAHFSSLNLSKPAPLMLVGVLPQSPSPLVVDATPDHYAYANLLMMDVPIKGDGGTFVPATMSRTQLVDYSGFDYFDLSYDGVNLSTSSGELIFACNSGLTAGAFKPFETFLHMQSPSGKAASVFAFNYQSKQWQLIRQSLDGQARVVLPQNCLNPIDSSAFIKVVVDSKSQNAQGAVLFSMPQLEYSGVVLQDQRIEENL